MPISFPASLCHPLNTYLIPDHRTLASHCVLAMQDDDGSGELNVDSLRTMLQTFDRRVRKNNEVGAVCMGGVRLHVHRQIQIAHSALCCGAIP